MLFIRLFKCRPRLFLTENYERTKPLNNKENE